ncbi:MAG: dTMP kinase [Treponema sp.]|jgi:dTMP kinase|nr:dTMP kinase [Treponema sp.]
MLIIHNFAVFEGGDGSGTSTQLDLLQKRFSRRENRSLPPFYATFEPTGGPVGELVRRALREDPVLDPKTTARLFAADRTEHLYGKDGVAARCGRGELVVSDRYTPSSLVYQGLDCGEDLPECLNRDFPGPELLLFFDIDPEIALKRLENRPVKDRYEYLEFQVEVRRRYHRILPRYEAEGVRVAYLDASLPPEEVAEAVWRELEKLPIMKGYKA